MTDLTRNRLTLATLLLLGFALCFNPTALAAAGDLDPSFGDGGKVTTTFGNGNAEAHDVTVQPDGKILVAGSASDDFFALARYNADGSLDATFGDGGRVTTDFLPGPDRASAVLIQPDGKVVVVGTASGGNIALARYSGDGSLDPTFGGGGTVVTTLAGFAIAWDGAIQPDGKIVVAGGVAGDILLVRYNGDGSLDAGFGSGGVVTTDFFGFGDEANAVALQPDGRIVAAGYAFYGSSPVSNQDGDFALVRYNSDGSLDPTFGTGGKVTTEFMEGVEMAGALTLQADGKIVAAGFATETVDSGFMQLALARYNAEGGLDDSFGAGGKVVKDISGYYGEGANAVLQQPDGKILLVGSASSETNSGADFVALRYTGDGSLDADFGDGGTLFTDFFGRNDLALAAVLQPDGKLIAAGIANSCEEVPGPTENFMLCTSMFALARYENDFEGEPPADVSITMSASPDPVTQMSNLTYTITVSNGGPGAATGITVTDATPQGTNFVSATASAGAGCSTDSGGVITCGLGDLAAGASATVTITVSVATTPGGSIINTAQVSGTSVDPDGSNNAVTVNTSVVGGRPSDPGPPPNPGPPSGVPPGGRP